MRFFDGLYSYEIVLLVLGVVLFLVLLICLAILVMRAKPFVKLVPFFAIAIIMIGFPSISSIEFSNGVVRIDKDTHDLQQDATNKSLRDALANEVANLSRRPSSDPAVIVTMAHAQIALGRNAEAIASFNKAAKLAPQLPQVIELRQRLELDNKLTDLATKVEQQPSDSAAREELQKILREASSRPIASPVTIANIARGQAAIGDQTHARSNLERALKIDPNLAPGIQLKSKIESH